MPSVGGVSVGVYTCVRKILHVCNIFIACVDGAKWTAAIFETKVCNFSRGQL